MDIKEIKEDIQENIQENIKVDTKAIKEPKGVAVEREEEVAKKVVKDEYYRFCSLCLYIDIIYVYQN